MRLPEGGCLEEAALRKLPWKNRIGEAALCP
jgi:hypothetical protein